MAKVLIYGFGWSGQSMLELCSKLGFECRVVDDGINLAFTQDDTYMDSKDIASVNFDIYFICCVQKEMRDTIFQKLQCLNLPKNKIKFIQTYAYKNKMSFLLQEYFSNLEQILQEWLQEPQDMPNFHKKIQAMQEHYFKTKAVNSQSLLEWRSKIDALIPNQNVFSKIYLSALVKPSHISYPGFSVGISFDKTEDKDFYFVKKIDFEAIKDRPKNVKLIACFGNSALRVEYLPYEESITAFLQKEVGDSYIVLNFGVTGYTVYEQLMLYNALCFELKPELVISFFLGTDFRSGLIDCDVLVKRHKILYGTWWAEGDYKKTSQSEMPLLFEMGKVVNTNISFNAINAAMKMRLEQFKSIVCGGGGANLSPLSSLYCLAS